MLHSVVNVGKRGEVGNMSKRWKTIECELPVIVGELNGKKVFYDKTCYYVKSNGMNFVVDQDVIYNSNLNYQRACQLK
jgi:hypothetical protein